MIKNLVFDFGQVMVHFEPKYMVEQYVSDPADSALLQEVVFDRLYWDRLDDGTITDCEVVEGCRSRLPERLHEVAEKIYYNWIYNIPEFDGMRALVREMRERFGVHVFLLSNISRYFADHADEIPCLAEFEKCIFSAVCGSVKPSANIFAHLCSECGIRAEESLFIDDSQKNIKGAADFGIHGYIFDGDVEKLRNFLIVTLTAAQPHFKHDAPMYFVSPVDGDCVNLHDGEAAENGIIIPVKLKAPEGCDIRINGVTAEYLDGIYETKLRISGFRTSIVAEDRTNGRENRIDVYYLPRAMGKYRLSSDDNILFLQDINDHRDQYKSIFDNPYLAVYKKAHDLYGAKVHLNLFYELNELQMRYFSSPREYFNLSMMTDKFKEEFRANSDWLKLAFHANAEFPNKPYRFATAEEITEDCAKVCREIIRFAGPEVLTSSTTIHWGEANRDCVRALRSLGMRSLTGYFEHDAKGEPCVAYYAPDDLIDHVGERDFWYDRREDMFFGRIDLVLNLNTYEWVAKNIRKVVAHPHKNGFVSVMIHEQYFYSDYKRYLPDFEARVLDTCKYLAENDYVGAHISEVTAEPEFNTNYLFNY